MVTAISPVFLFAPLMHEMGIALEILNVAMAAIPPDMRDAKVEALNIKVGKLSGVVPQSLRFCFDVAVSDTPFAGVRLNIEEVPIEVECRDCGARMIIETAHFVCRGCQGARLELISGRELLVTSVEVADTPASSG
ncbi:MAG: hydrogenase maturation nickel metallochaperone HypA [Terriglobales bacterium]